MLYCGAECQTADWPAHKGVCRQASTSAPPQLPSPHHSDYPDAAALTALYEEGWAWKMGRGVPQDGRTAVDRWRRAAEGGHAPAQYRMGLCCEGGKNVAVDLDAARGWYALAAKQGLPMAVAAHARLSPPPLRPSTAAATAEAAELQRAAEAGDAAACYELGWWAKMGRGGLPMDGRTAVQWWRTAALRGNASAMHRLGVCYEGGKNVPRDMGAARDWYGRAAAAGLGVAKEAHARLGGGPAS
jgi:TPR repeat protein